MVLSVYKGAVFFHSPILVRLEAERHGALFCPFEERSDAADGDAIDQLFFFNAHEIHRHLAGDHLDARRLRALNQRFEWHDVIRLHNTLHHARSHAQHMELRQSEFLRALREHGGKEACGEGLFHFRRVLAAEDRKPPKREEHRDVRARRRRAVGDNEGGKCLVEVARKDENRLVARACRCGRGGSLCHGKRRALFYLHADACVILLAKEQSIARRAAPSEAVLVKAFVRRRDLDGFAGRKALDELLECEDGARAAKAGDIDALDDFCRALRLLFRRLRDVFRSAIAYFAARAA